VQSLLKLTTAVAAASVPAPSVTLETKQSEPEPKKKQPAASNAGKGELTPQQLKQKAKKEAKAKAKQAAKAKREAQAKNGNNSKGQAPAADLFAELDIRVGKILSAEQPATSDKVFTEVIDCGDEDGPRTIASGLVGYYTKEQLTGRMVVVLCNLAPKSMKFIAPDYKSQGMVLCANLGGYTEGAKTELLEPPEGAKIGERISFAGLPPAPPAKPKRVERKGCFRKTAQFLKTSEDRVALYRTHAFTTSAGPITVPTLVGASIS